MCVSRSGYYKWKNRKPSSREMTREKMVKTVSDVHDNHSTHGYRWVAAFIRINLGHNISENYAYKCFKYLGIKAETKHRIRRRPRKKCDKYPNLIFSSWETVDRPKQVIVSDMTVLKSRIFYFETTFYFDVFTKEMLSWKLAERRGCRSQYIEGLVDVKELLKGCTEPAIVHTDQGSVYASMAYNELIKDTCIVRSMSRAGKPTDNPVNEALNGWMKEELLIDFKMDKCHNKNQVKALLTRYMKFYNEQRPCWAIGYDTPDNYRKRFYKGELEQKNTFENRVLTAEPKFVQKRRKNAHLQDNTE
jgi:putative transposase